MTVQMAHGVSAALSFIGILLIDVVCAVETLVQPDGSSSHENTYPIAGNLKIHGGGDFDVKATLLSTSESNEDSKKEGLRLELFGGQKQTDTQKRTQSAIIEFLCDKSRTGLEHLSEERDQYEERDEEVDDDPSTPSLTFVSYNVSKKNPEEDLLRLQWKTKEACEDSKAKKDQENSGHWGFFTWFVIMYAPFSIFNHTC
jgi:hypothetical protein